MYKIETPYEGENGTKTILENFFFAKLVTEKYKMATEYEAG